MIQTFSDRFFLLSSVNPNKPLMFANYHITERKNDSSPIPEESAKLADSVLWQRFRTGNDLAFSILYKKYIQRLFNYGMHTCYDRELVLDTLQELFGRLWSKRSDLSDVEAVSSYLYKSFRRLLVNKLISKRKQMFLLINSNDKSFEILSSIEDSIILQETTVEQYARLKRAISTLTKRQREVIFLRFYNNLSCKDVAQVMDMSVESVYNLVTKAIEALRITLKSE